MTRQEWTLTYLIRFGHCGAGNILVETKGQSDFLVAMADELGLNPAGWGQFGKRMESLRVIEEEIKLLEVAHDPGGLGNGIPT